MLLRRVLRCLLLALFCNVDVAHAVPLIWTFHHVTFADGASLTGWFEFDADTNNSDGLLHHFDVSVTGGDSQFPALHVTPATIDNLMHTQVYRSFMAVANHSNTLPDTSFVAIHFTQAMTDSGGSIPILLSTPAHPSSAYEGFDPTVYGPGITRNIADGYISAPAIPEPSVLVFSMLGIAAVVVWCRGVRSRVRGARMC